MKTSTTKTNRPKTDKNSDAFLAYMASTRCSVTPDAWKDRKAVKANQIEFVVGKESGITFRV
jgi:hypothetical protein